MTRIIFIPCRTAWHTIKTKIQELQATAHHSPPPLMGRQQSLPSRVTTSSHRTRDGRKWSRNSCLQKGSNKFGVGWNLARVQAQPCSSLGGSYGIYRIFSSPSLMPSIISCLFTHQNNIIQLTHCRTFPNISACWRRPTSLNGLESDRWFGGQTYQRTRSNHWIWNSERKRIAGLGSNPDCIIILQPVWINRKLLSYEESNWKITKESEMLTK